jgi:HAD superfamily hydrolase (TIGR01509 family)
MKNAQQKLEAVVFDFDGILVDSEPVHQKALSQILVTHGLPSLSWESYKQTVLGFSDAEAIHTLHPKLPREQIAKMVSEKALVFRAIAPRETRLQPGILELLASLQQARLPVGIASGALRGDINAVLYALGGAPLFSNFLTVAAADEVTYSKPHPETYLLACSRLGVDPRGCVSFEDTVHGIHAAKGAGLFCVGVTHTLSAEALRPHAHLVIDGFQGWDFFRIQKLFPA